MYPADVGSVYDGKRQGGRAWFGTPSGSLVANGAQLAEGEIDKWYRHVDKVHVKWSVPRHKQLDYFQSQVLKSETVECPVCMEKISRYAERQRLWSPAYTITYSACSAMSKICLLSGSCAAGACASNALSVGGAHRRVKTLGRCFNASSTACGHACTRLIGWRTSRI